MQDSHFFLDLEIKTVVKAWKFVCSQCTQVLIMGAIHTRRIGNSLSATETISL
jgi:predicted RNA-binding Zn-ribbon protein involved in translation (DUF1610 family)